MDDRRKTKAQLIEELRSLRGEVERLRADVKAGGNEREDRLQRESESHYRQLVEFLPISVVIHSKGRLVFMNRAAARDIGVEDRDRVYGLPVLDFIHPDYHGMVENRLANLSIDEPPRFVEEKLVRIDGTPIDVELAALPFMLRGEPAVQVVMRDITERKRADAALRESEERFRKVFEEGPVGMAMVTPDLRFIKVNAVFCRMLGYPEGELLGMDIRDVTHPDDRKMDLEYADAVLSGELSSYQFEKRYVTKGGEVIWGRRTASFVRDGTGRTRYGIGIIENITDRKREREALRQSEERYRQLVELSPDGILVHCNARVEFANTSALALLGATSIGQIRGRDLFDFVDPEFHAVVQRRLESLGERAPLAQEKLVRLDGRVFDAEVTALPFVHDGRPAVQAIFRDITQRKQAEEALRESEERFRKVFEEGPVGMLIIHPDCQSFRVNEAFCRMLRYSQEELHGRTIVELTHPEDYPKHSDCMRQLRSGESAWRQLVERYLTKEGGVIWGRFTASMVSDSAGHPLYILGIVEDITERKQAQEALQRSERRFRSLVQNASDVTIILEADGTVRYQSPAFHRVLGWSEGDVVGNTVYDLIHPDDRERVMGLFGELVAAPDFSVSAEVRVRALDGSYVLLEGICHNLLDDEDVGGIVINARDITERRRSEEERKRLEAQVLHAQKLESLGVLAGGIAHDFNNLLTGVLGNADLALTELSPVSPARPSIQQIEMAARRAAELTRQMLAYSGKGTFVIQPLRLSEVVEEMAHLLKVSISKKCLLQYRFAEHVPPIEGDASQMRQIIMNLIINASEAIGERSGVISIRTGAVECDRAYLSESYLDENLSPGLYVYLEVADTGCGMTDEVRLRLFDPFFSTKFTGRGLGLAAVLGIVRSHSGAIKVYSEPGRGTTFKVLFPAAPHAVVEASSAGSEPAEWRASGTVLVVDDDETVRALAKRMLERSGFSVVTASDGREGVEQYRVHADNLRMVLLDMTMPHMDGEEAFRAMRRIREAIPVILTSGYSEQDATSRFSGKGLAGFLQKPFRTDELIAVVRRSLGG